MMCDFYLRFVPEIPKLITEAMSKELIFNLKVTQIDQ